jgi:hypothetical protein
MSETEFGISNVIVSTYAHWVIFGCSVFALGWGGANAILVRKVELNAENI